MSTKDERIAELEAERDALAAHVERIQMAWMFDGTGIHDKRIEHVRLPYLRYEAVNQAIMAAPTTSLVRRDARMKAEALESAVRTAQTKSQTAVARWLKHMANNCHKQAEEAS